MENLQFFTLRLVLPQVWLPCWVMLIRSPSPRFCMETDQVTKLSMARGRTSLLLTIVSKNVLFTLLQNNDKIALVIWAVVKGRDRGGSIPGCLNWLAVLPGDEETPRYSWLDIVGLTSVLVELVYWRMARLYSTVESPTVWGTEQGGCTWSVCGVLFPGNQNRGV